MAQDPDPILQFKLGLPRPISAILCADIVVSSLSGLGHEFLI